MPVSLIFLFTAIFFYAVAGSPTPDHPAFVEAIIGITLSFAVIGVNFRQAFSIQHRSTGYMRWMVILFLSGLVLPTFVGVLTGNGRMLMVRDLLAFSFLGLPLFLNDAFRKNHRAFSLLLYFLIFAGVSFCIRTLIPAFNVWIPQGELLYLSNSPLALFSAVYLAGRFWESLEYFSKEKVVFVLACLAGLAILIAAMLLDIQRATVGAVFLTWAILAIEGLIKNPRRIVFPLLIVFIFGFITLPVLSDALNAMAVKTAQVGMNARFAEAAAVLDALTAAPFGSIIWGLGWGAEYASPAVGGLTVNYTHSFLTTMALKGGLILFILSCAMVMAALCRIFHVFRCDKALALALLFALAVPVFLYASHKSLDFGLILLLIGVWSTGPDPLHKCHSSGKTEGYPQETKSG